jgi:hypothetical protein
LGEWECPIFSDPIKSIVKVLSQSLETAMNLKFIAPIAVFAAANGFGGGLPLAYAQEQDETAPTEFANGQIIPYTCYDRAGNVVFVTVNPQETVGWELGCREVQYESSVPNAPPATYFQCFDVNGGVAFNTVDSEVAEASELFCREIGFRSTTPVPLRPIHYECYNVDGSVAFTTSYPQNTYGWKPGCRELQYQDAALAQSLETPQSVYECFDINGNVAFTTYEPQDARRWKLGCRQIQ